MTTLLKTLVILCISFLVISCNNDDDERRAQNQMPANSYFLKAKVNGVQYTATSAQTNATKIGSGALTTATINSSVAGKNFKFILIGAPATGTFHLDCNSLKGKMSLVETSLNYSTIICPVNSGILIITAVTNTLIEGNFNFVAKSSASC